MYQLREVTQVVPEPPLPPRDQTPQLRGLCTVEQALHLTSTADADHCHSFADASHGRGLRSVG